MADRTAVGQSVGGELCDESLGVCSALSTSPSHRRSTFLQRIEWLKKEAKSLNLQLVPA
jgi:hypothetical protein